MTTQSVTKPAAEPQAAVAVIGQAAPSTRARALSRADWLRARFRGVGTRERWGYGVWLFVGLIFGVPESWAGITSPPWPALSDTLGHLEQLWHPVRVIVVALIVFIVFHAVRYPPGHTGEFTAGEGRPERARTPCGRFARCGTGTGSAVSVFVYFPLASARAVPAIPGRERTPPGISRSAELPPRPSPSISASTPYSADRSSSPVSTACALCRRSAQARSHRYA